MRKRLVVILAVAVFAVLAWAVYRTFYPSESFYREEFEVATGFPLPESARRLAGCSEWGMTAAIHEVGAEDWPSLSRALRGRADSTGAVTSFCEPLLSSLDGEAFVLSTGRRKVIVGLDDQRRRVFWEVWHG